MAEDQPQSSANANSSTAGPRKKYLKNLDYFMAVARLAARRSKDPSTKVGACIVNQEDKIVSIGHNGTPNGCDDDSLQWTVDTDDRFNPYGCHAELNAMMNKNSADVKGCTMFVTLFPCNECTKLIIQAGITKVLYLSDDHDKPEVAEASKKMLDLAKIDCSQFEPEETDIVINLQPNNTIRAAPPPPVSK